jgi:hypothetical protein
MDVKKLLPIVALLPILAFAACNGDDDADDETPTPGSADQTATPGGGATSTAPAGGTPAVETPSGTPGAFSGSTNPVEVASPSNPGQPRIVAIRAAAQQGFDRLVFEFSGSQVPGYKVAYGDEAIACGSGMDLTEFIGGGAAPEGLLLIDMRPSAAHDDAGQPTVARDLEPALSSLKRVVRTCDFEGVVGYGAAISAEKPFKVTTLNDPPRLVIDIGQ